MGELFRELTDEEVNRVSGGLYWGYTTDQVASVFAELAVSYNPGGFDTSTPPPDTRLWAQFEDVTAQVFSIAQQIFGQNLDNQQLIQSYENSINKSINSVSVAGTTTIGTVDGKNIGGVIGTDGTLYISLNGDDRVDFMVRWDGSKFYVNNGSGW